MGLAHPPLSPVGLELWRWIECSAPLFYDANFWDCLAHLSVERPPGRRLVAPCGMALVMRVGLKDILEAFEFVSADSTGEHQAFLCRQSGKVYWYVESSDDELSELPDDTDDREKYVQIP